MGEWKDMQPKHIREHLLRSQWDLQRKPLQETGAGAIIPKGD
jgi:hypothetical protein